MNKILSSSLVLAAMMSLVGCGGSSDPVDSAVTNTASTVSAATGTAYYIDSAVGGVNYKCGTQEGITGADGSFTFEVGQSCTFYLGDIKLRGVDAALLVDGGDIQETDINIARILQSLDTDGNPANGISIDAAIVAAMAAEGITKLPDTVAEMEEVLAVIETAGGKVVSEDAAVEHMLTTVLIGKTLYQHWKECEKDTVSTLTFGEDGQIVMSDEAQSLAYRIEGNIIYTTGKEGEEPHSVAEVTTEYIKINETNGEITMFYFTKEAAQAAPADDQGCNNVSAADILMGKTFYEADAQNQTYTSTEYLSDKAIFKEFQYDGTFIEDFTATATYDGENYTVRSGDAYSTCSVERRESSLFMTCHNDTDNWTGTLWDTADLAMANVPTAVSPIDQTVAITASMLTANAFYDEDSDDNGYAYGKTTFTTTTAERHEIWYNTDGTVREDSTFSFPVAIVDGKLRVDVTQFGEGYMWFTLLSVSDTTSWQLVKEQDTDMDGNMDVNSTQYTEWYLSRPDYFPASL